MEYVAKVAKASAGVFTDYDYIIDRLPYCIGLQFEQLWWNEKGIKTEDLGSPNTNSKTV